MILCSALAVGAFSGEASLFSFHLFSLSIVAYCAIKGGAWRKVHGMM
jgi:hypothetical protein